ncbi:hypothetical protein BaRGS_00036719, partial [Batillaria attramentaria]
TTITDKGLALPMTPSDRRKAFSNLADDGTPNNSKLKRDQATWVIGEGPVSG